MGTCNMPTCHGLLLHLTHDFLGKIFPVEDEAVEVRQIGVVDGILHTPKVFEPHCIPNIRSNDAPKADSSRTPIAWGVETYTPDFHVLTPPGHSFSHALTSHSPDSQPLVHHQWILRSST